MRGKKKRAALLAAKKLAEGPDEAGPVRVLGEQPLQRKHRNSPIRKER